MIRQCLPRHCRQEFLTFLKKIDRQTPAEVDLHCIVDNYATHNKQEKQDWLAAHPRLDFHFIPTSSSWLNLIERWFAKMTNQRIHHHNANPKPFIWTKSANEFVEKVNRGQAMLGTLH